MEFWHHPCFQESIAESKRDNMKNHSVRYFAPFMGLAMLTALAAHAGPSQVAVSSGYNDEPRNGVPFSSGSGQPVPWYGSPDTTFYGNASVAQAYDPDEDAILLENLGATSISLTAASIGSYNLFSLDSISSPVALNPDQFVIIAGVDGSDAFSGVQTVGLTIGGTSYSYSDVTASQAPDGVLDGAMPWIGGAESMPWTSIYAPRISGPPVPDSSSAFWLFGIALCGLAICRWHRNRPQTA
jgi:hypothetical protein